jgi:hypothetical protein
MSRKKKSTCDKFNAKDGKMSQWKKEILNEVEFYKYFPTSGLGESFSPWHSSSFFLSD